MIKLVLITFTVASPLSLFALLFIRGWLIEKMREEVASLREEIKAERFARTKWQEAFEQKHQSPWHIHTKGKTA